MNKWTLKFNDEQLEQKYQEEQKPEQLRCLGINLLLSFTSCLISGIYWILDLKYILGFVLILSSILSPFQYYVIVHKRYFSNYVNHILWAIRLAASLSQLVPLFYPDLSLSTMLWYDDLITFTITQFSTSTNPVPNVLFWVVFLSIKLGVRVQVQFNLLSVCFTLFVILSMYNDYERIKILRQLFLHRTKNIQSNDILDKMVTDNIVTLNFDQQQFKFNVIFTNQSFLNNISQNPYYFLKSVFVVNSRISLFSAIFQQIKNKLKSFEYEVKLDKQRFILRYLIQYFDEIIITININKIFKKTNIKSLQFPFYRALLQQVKQSNKKIYQKEKFKHLLTYILYAPQKLNLQILPLQSRQLNYIMLKYCPDVEIKYETTISSIVILIDMYFYLLIKLYILQKISISQKSGKSNLVIRLKLLRKNTKSSISQFNKFKKNIMNQIATQNSTIEKINLLDLKEIAKSQQFRMT